MLLVISFTTFTFIFCILLSQGDSLHAFLCTGFFNLVCCDSLPSLSWEFVSLFVRFCLLLSVISPTYCCKSCYCFQKRSGLSLFVASGLVVKVLFKNSFIVSCQSQAITTAELGEDKTFGTKKWWLKWSCGWRPLPRGEKERSILTYRNKLHQRDSSSKKYCVFIFTPSNCSKFL